MIITMINAITVIVATTITITTITVIILAMHRGNIGMFCFLGYATPPHPVFEDPLYLAIGLFNPDPWENPESKFPSP